MQSGEGVFGLRRAFQRAGAQAMIISMFSVPDESTARLMNGFYSSWINGKSKSASMHDAALSSLKERRAANGTVHPLFWGGFILIGNPD